MSSVRDGFGKAKEGSGLEFLKVGEGKTEQFRIFPPKGKLAQAGIYALYLQQHYGYTVPDSRDPTKPARLKPFQCVEEKDGDKVVVSCPECRKIEDRTRMRDDQKAAETARLVGQGVEKSAAEAQATKLVEGLSKWLKAHNLDRKWYLLAMAEDGRIGFLVIPHKVKKQMDVEKKKLMAEEKIDLLDIDKGAWVEITRTGKNRDTEYTVRIATEQIVTQTGSRAKVTKVSGFTDQQLEIAFALPDLDSPALMKRLTREQVRMLAEGNEVPEEVEAIMNFGQKVDAGTGGAQRREESPAPRPEPTRTGASGGAESAPAPKAAPVSEADIEALVQARLAALAPKPTPQPEPSSAVMDIKALSDAEFLAKFGSK